MRSNPKVTPMSFNPKFSITIIILITNHDRLLKLRSKSIEQSNSRKLTAISQPFSSLFNLIGIFFQSLQLIYRRKKRLVKFGFKTRSEIPLASIDCGLGMTCHYDLCIRASLNYENFYILNSIKKASKISQLSSVTLMAIDLKKYGNFERYEQALRQHSYFLRSNKKAIKQGYWVEQFQYQNHTPDIREIRNSVDQRAIGLPIDYFVLTENVLNTNPTKSISLEEPQCPNHWEQWFGVFLNVPGHLQGTLVHNKKLVAYARLRRIGNTVKYAEFIGHGDHLQFSVMTLLHIHLIKWVIDDKNKHTNGVQYVTYNTVEKGNEGILYWKRKALFTPFAIQHIEPELPNDFVPEIYLSLNPDLKESIQNAGTHFLRHGQVENRPYKYDLPVDFDPDRYIKLNPDLKDLKINPKLHYMHHGKFENRPYN